MSFKIKDKVEVISKYVALKGVVGEVAEINRGKCLVYFKQLKDNESITNLEALHDACKYQESKYFWLEKSNLKIVKEEKMDQVKIVRKLEELDSYVNENGELMIFFNKNKGVIQIKCADYPDDVFCEILYSHLDLFPTTIKILKELGFRFEYKPLRTKEEIMSDLVEKEFKFGEGNYILIKHEHGYYDYMNNMSFYTLGQKYYSLESLKKVVNELNEILESEKNGF